jgi:polysaccharide pyruvyl transferase WcaK-like protein
VVCFTNDPPARVAASLAVLRDVAAEIVVAVDDRVDPGDLAPLHAVADRVVRAEFAPPLEANLAWLHAQATADWVLRVDGDDVVSAALVERLATPGWDHGITHAYVSYRWLWGGPDQVLAQPPWWPDPALRLIRNVPGIARFPHGAHRPPEVAGDARFLDEAVYHLDLLLADEGAREAKADRYERDAVGLRIDQGWSVNTTYYLPERMEPAPRTEPVPEADAEVVRAVLAASPSSASTGPTGPTPAVDHVTVADRAPAPIDAGDATLRVVARAPLAVVGGRTYTLTVGVTNGGDRTWRPDEHPAPLLVGQVHAADGSPFGAEVSAPLPGPVAPGDEVLVRLAVPSFPPPGPASLHLDLAVEGRHIVATVLEVPLEVQLGRRVLVSTGVSPTRHLGDDLITGAVLAALARDLPDVVPVMLAHSPDGLTERFGCPVAPTPSSGRPFLADTDAWESDLLRDAKRIVSGEHPLDPANGALVEPFVHASALLVAPGGGLTSTYGREVIGPTALEVQLAAACGVPVLVEGAYVGPLTWRRERIAVLRIARTALRFTVRDVASADAVRELGAFEEPPAIVPDPATAVVPLAVRTASASARAWLDARGIPEGRPYAVFSLRAGTDGAPQVDALREITARLPEGAAAVYLPHCTGELVDDRMVLAGEPWAEANLTVVGPDVDDHTAVALVAGAILTAGSRFHLAVLARAAGVPAVSFVADQYDDTRLAALDGDPGTFLVPYGDSAAASQAAARALLVGRTDPIPTWDRGDLVATLASLLPPAPRLA